MNPFRIITRIRIKLFRTADRLGLAQQLRHLHPVVARPQVQRHPHRQQAAAKHHYRKFDPLAARPVTATAKVGAGRARGQPGRVHRHRRRRGGLLRSRLPDPSHQRFDQGQHLAARIELLERGEMGQPPGQPQPLTQGVADGEHFQHTAVSALQIGAQDQASQKPALGEIMPAAGGAVIGQMLPAQTHRHFNHLFHHGRFLPHAKFVRHALLYRRP